MSSGSRGLVGEVLGWVIGLGLCAVALLHYDDVKRFVMQQAGLIATAEPDARSAAATVGAPRAGGSVELRLSRDGHFHAEIEINGRAVNVMIDTGATMVALSHEDAERAGIYVKDADFTHRVSTANGTGRIAPIVIERISIGDITVRNVQAAVTEPGRLRKSLLGMTFLGRLSRTEMRGGMLVLED